MWFLILSGIVAFLGGILILFSPNTLRDLNAKVSAGINKMVVSVDEKVYKLRIGVGVSLLLISGTIFFIIYYLIKKYH
jgi:cytochrome c biogenesis protein CcdA